MLGGLKKKFPKINGLNGSESNPDIAGKLVRVQPVAEYQGQLTHDPDHHFPGVDLQIFGGAQGENRVPNMQGFVKSYATQGMPSDRARAVMNYFEPGKISVLTTLATEFAVFNHWFSSIPGPTICNRAFAHYGTSFGNVDMNIFLKSNKSPTIYERMRSGGHSAKLYYYDQASSGMEIVNLIQDQSFFGTFDNFVRDCMANTLAEYCFIEPNYSDHTGPDGQQLIATDQHPDHNVLAGDLFIGRVYNAIRINPDLWHSTALLITYDTHGGLYDHVPPPACTPDDFVASKAQTGTGFDFKFDRLGVRVPAVLVSPWVSRGTVIDDVYEHASIPATVTSHFVGDFEQRTAREKKSNTFLHWLSDSLRPDHDCVFFKIDDQRTGTDTTTPKVAQPRQSSTRKKRNASVGVPPPQSSAVPELRVGPSTHVARDRWTIEDSLGHTAYAYAIYRFLTAKETKPPLAISIQAPWGGGKTSLMRMIQWYLDSDASKRADQSSALPHTDAEAATVKHVLDELKEVSDNSLKQLHKSGTIASPSGISDSTSAIKDKTAIPPIPNEGQRRVTIWFNAWKYESTAQVWAGLADCIVHQIGERLDPVARELFWFWLQLRRFDASKIREKILREILADFFPKLIKWSWAYVSGIVVMAFAAMKHAWPSAGGVLIAEFLALWGQLFKTKSETEAKPASISLGELVQAPDYSANLGFVHEVVEDLKRVFAAIPKKDLPMVIFIDDLDRCSPGKVASVVEAINLFLAGEFPDCMFVLGIDDEMIAAALDKAHSDVIANLPAYTKSSSIGWRFMDKFVQLPFVIPLPAERDLAKYVNSLFSKDGSGSVDLDVLDRAARLFEQGRRQLPRSK